MSGARSSRAQLAFPLLILLALAGALLAAGSRPPAVPVAAARPAAPRSAAADRAAARRLTRIAVTSTPKVARRVEQVRGLRFDRLPRPDVVTSGFLNRLGVREAHGRMPGVGADNAVGRITGQLQPGDDLADAYTSTGDLAAAAYDPKTKRLYVVSDAAGNDRSLVEFVLSHELDHALEDQGFGVGGSGSAPRNDDAALARTAQIEGSATTVMTDYATRYLNPLELIGAAQGIDDGSGSVPKAYLDQLTWAYLGGKRFIDSLRELGGGWTLVDYALSSRPPATTEQVLHPAKYVHDELPVAVRIDATALRARGWRPADRGVLGELPTSYLLRVGVDPASARRAAAGWNGDRYELWRRDVAPSACEYPCRSDLALVAKWEFDRMPDALEFESAARMYLSDGLDAEKLGGPAWRLAGGYASVATAARASAIAFAPTEELARRAAAAQIR